MADQDTPEQICEELHIRDFDPANARDKMFLGIITKLRAKNRETTSELTTAKNERDEMRGKLTGFERKEKESEIITAALGDGHQLPTDAEGKAKFERWKQRALKADDWEEQLKEVVADFRVPKADAKKGEGDKGKPDDKGDDKKPDAKGADGKGADDKKPDGKPDDKKASEDKPGYRLRTLQGDTTPAKGTEIRRDLSPSELLKLKAEDPTAYAEAVR